LPHGCSEQRRQPCPEIVKLSTLLLLHALSLPEAIDYILSGNDAARRLDELASAAVEYVIRKTGCSTGRSRSTRAAESEHGAAHGSQQRRDIKEEIMEKAYAELDRRWQQTPDDSTAGLGCLTLLQHLHVKVRELEIRLRQCRAEESGLGEAKRDTS